jgi:dTMP kinase
MARGAFITLEGAEGVGKSTCLALIGGRLEARGRDVVTTREPGGTPIGEHIREWLLNGTHAHLSAEVEAVLMFAARAVHVEAVIEPALASGRWVVCDRFSDATFAYQGGGRGADQELLRRLESGVLRGLQADLTLLLDAPVDIGLARIRGRPLDRFEREDRPFFERVRAAYLERARLNSQRIKVVDASRPLGEVEQQLLETLDAFERTFGERRAE